MTVVLRLYGPRNRNGNNRAVYVEVDELGHYVNVAQDLGNKPEFARNRNVLPIEVPARELRQWLNLYRYRQEQADAPS